MYTQHPKSAEREALTEWISKYAPDESSRALARSRAFAMAKSARANDAWGAIEWLEDAIKIIKREARTAPNLPLKLKFEREKRNIETNRDEAWKEYEEAARDIEKRKDSLIDEVEKKLSQHLSQKNLFTIRWRIE